MSEQTQLPGFRERVAEVRDRVAEWLVTFRPGPRTYLTAWCVGATIGQYAALAGSTDPRAILPAITALGAQLGVNLLADIIGDRKPPPGLTVEEIAQAVQERLEQGAGLPAVRTLLAEFGTLQVAWDAWRTADDERWRRLAEELSAHPQLIAAQVTQEVVAALDPRLAGLEERSRCIEDLLAQAATESGALTVEVRPRRFSEAEWTAAEQRYRELALEACDIIDLANLPEDRHLAMQHLELRRLYVPLRVRVETLPDAESDEARMGTLEEGRKRATRRDPLEREAPPEENARASVGERLGAAQRLVILGDPGAGKSTLLRWIATAYLLRLKQDPDWRQLPDVATLPDADWLPVLIRCRDLGRQAVEGALDDMLSHTLRKAEMTEEESACFRGYLPEKLLRGEALLLIDGLDEIQEPQLRARFCQQLERIQSAYQQAPIVVTSRIVGYRETGFRIGRGFEHLIVTDLEREEKDEFVRRWCALTERPERRDLAVRELIHDIHSTDRIERLTGNPMLLTTLALVKRKVGKLPHRRADLYWEAVNVLLNWRSEVDEPLDPREALPQLEYVAYAMCHQGVQRLRQDQVLELLESMRAEYPNVRPAHNHTPEEFLHLVERRTALVVEAGYVRYQGRPVQVYEFRHLTFQEYLAARALVEGKYPGRDRSWSLAEQVAPLAGQTAEVSPELDERELAVVENWREPLRLCVASCSDDDVEEVLLAILTPQPGEDRETTTRPRAVLAALCLADEPNVGDDTAQEVLSTLARQIGEDDGSGLEETTLDAAAQELAASSWTAALQAALVEEYRRRSPFARSSVGTVCGMVIAATIPGDADGRRAWLEQQVPALVADDQQAIPAALGIMAVAYRDQARVVPGLVDGLLDLLDRDAPTATAAAWALGWLASMKSDDAWKPGDRELERIGQFVADLQSEGLAVRLAARVLEKARDPCFVGALLARLDDPDAWARSAVAKALGRIRDARAVEPLLARLEDPDAWVRSAAAEALGSIGDVRAVEPLLARLEEPETQVRSAVAEALGRIGDARAVEPLLARLDDPDAWVRRLIVGALRRIGDVRAVEPLLARLDDPDMGVRLATLGALARRCEDETDRKLLSRNLNGLDPFLDPHDLIGEDQIRWAAASLGLPAEEIRQRYEGLAGRFKLRLAWKPLGQGYDPHSPESEGR